MYTKINIPKGINSGSSLNLVSYLDKEEKGYFFNSNSEVVLSSVVVNSIDSNCNQGVRKEDDKFYMLTFSPSEYELKSIIGREVNSFNELTYDEKIKLTNSMKEYTSEAMTLYAKSFNRNTIKDNKDLLYFGRIETQRTYNKFDKEVLNKEAKVGDTKTGLDVHVHIIVSRKSFDKKTLLSPNIRFRNCTFKKKIRMMQLIRM